MNFREDLIYSFTTYAHLLWYYLIILSLIAFYFILKASYYSCDSDIAQSDSKYPATRRRSRTRKMVILTNSQHQSNSPKKRFRKPQDRTIHNAKERACRERIAQKFDILRKLCSYLNTNRRVPSKHSILLAAKKECDLLKHFESKLVAEKKVWRKANDILKNRIAKLTKMIE